MGGTVAGGKAAAATNKGRYGSDFYAKIGAKGGKLGNTGGFAKRTECHCLMFPQVHTKPMCAGAKGGTISRKKKRA